MTFWYKCKTFLSVFLLPQVENDISKYPIMVHIKYGCSSFSGRLYFIAYDYFLIFYLQTE